MSCVILWAFNINNMVAQPTDTLSPKAKVSLITASAGNELYTVFGHTALRIVDPAKNIDRIYNYGTFNFDTEDFYWKFALGNLRYFLSVTPFKQAKKAYLKSGRAITEQRLNLSTAQIQKLFTYLQINARPENRYYSYKLFYDNCTTRVFDAIKIVTGDSLRLQQPVNTEKKSFRQFINVYLDPVPWVKLGINFLLGIPAERVPTGPETLFLPDLLKKSFGNSRIHNNNTTIPLVDSQFIYSPSNNAILNPPLVTPKLVFWSLFALVIPFGLGFPNKKTVWFWFDSILFSIVVGVGFLILFLWLFSSYTATKWNANIVWTLMAPIVLYIVTNKKKIHLEAWRLIELIILGVAFVAMTFSLIHQHIPAASYPLFGLLIFRGWIYFLMPNPTYASVLEVNHN